MFQRVAGVGSSFRHPTAVCGAAGTTGGCHILGFSDICKVRIIISHMLCTVSQSHVLFCNQMYCTKVFDKDLVILFA